MKIESTQPSTLPAKELNPPAGHTIQATPERGYLVPYEQPWIEVVLIVLAIVSVGIGGLIGAITAFTDSPQLGLSIIGISLANGLTCYVTSCIISYLVRCRNYLRSIDAKLEAMRQ